MYWAIVNGRREALSAIIGFISPAFSDNLRRACIATSDHTLFVQLSLLNTNINQTIVDNQP